jgi:hypothetical protein
VPPVTIPAPAPVPTGPGRPVRPGVLAAQYANDNAAVTAPQVQPGLAVRNTGTAPLDLSRVTLRYWFTDGGTSYATYCDYARIGCGSVTERVVLGGRPYLEVGFGSGPLAPGGSTGEIQTRFNRTDWSALTQTDDWSSGPAGPYADAPHVTAYVDGTKVWGSEP